MAAVIIILFIAILFLLIKLCQYYFLSISLVNYLIEKYHDEIDKERFNMCIQDLLKDKSFLKDLKNSVAIGIVFMVVVVAALIAVH